MILETAYETLRKCDLAESQYQFSDEWCGMSRTYLSWVKAAKAEPSHKALIQLVFKIDDKIGELSGHTEQEYPEVAAHDCEVLTSIRDDVMTYLRKPSVFQERSLPLQDHCR